MTDINNTFYTLNSATNTLTYNPSFNTITGAVLFRERQVQVAARFQF